MNHVLIVVANMKWNCNIVKDMYDRVLRRKFGILCKDDTSNEDFIKSYLNRLDCEPIDLSCLKGSNLPCTSNEASNTLICNVVVNVGLVLNQDNNYVFTANASNGVSPYIYAWTYNPAVWQLISNVNNVLILKPIVSGSVTTPVSVLVTDSRGCTKTWENNVLYLGGCTDPEALNYNPLATFDNGSCYYNPLSMSILYNCNPNESGTVCVYATGGVPPYTVVGIPSGTIPADNGIPICVNVKNGGSFGAYVIDSVGNTTLTQSGTVICPFNCESVMVISNYSEICLQDAFGNNTGQAQIYVSPSGGTIPYVVTITINGGPSQPFINGMIVDHDDELEITITDSNNCINTYLETVNCPPYIPEPTELTCEQIHSNTIVQATVTGQQIGTSTFPDGSSQQRKFTIGGFAVTLPAPLTIANLTSIEYKFNDFSNNVQDTYGPVPSALPAPTGYMVTSIGASDQYISTFAGLFCPASTMKIYLWVKLTIDNGGTPCVVEFYKSFTEIFADCDDFCESCTYSNNPQTSTLIPL